MPTYEYVCDACGHAFDHFQSISEAELTKCPECKKKKLRRLMGTGAALMFKGSGFYTTDYRSDSYKKSASADKPSGESSKSESSSGGDKSKSDSGKSDKSSSKPKTSSKD